MTTSQSPAIDPAGTINEAMARYPATMAVFNQFGIDICCGSGALVRDAANRDGANLDALLAALRAAANNS